jgi:hypothetical protein
VLDLVEKSGGRLETRVFKGFYQGNGGMLPHCMLQHTH